jgi:hypothetical protein
VPVEVNQSMYGVAAAIIATEVGPTQLLLVSSASADPYPVAAKPSSAAKLSQASEAANSGPGPGPEYIRPELTSGGNTAKSSTGTLRQQSKWCLRRQPPHRGGGVRRCHELVSNWRVLNDRPIDIDARNTVCGHRRNALSFLGNP